jgi:hypothetical protein
MKNEQQKFALFFCIKKKKEKTTKEEMGSFKIK